MSPRRRLVLESIPPDFSPSTHVALGPWCFFRAETVYPEWEALPFVNAFSTVADRCAAGEACRFLANQRLDRLWGEMNRRHGTTHSRDFWHVVMMSWLMHLVMTSWRLWRHTEEFIARSGEERFDVGVAVTPGSIRGPSTKSFVLDCYLQSDFRAWLTSEIVRRLAPDRWSLEAVRTIEPTSPKPLPPTARTRHPLDRVDGMRRWRSVLSALIGMLPPGPAAQRQPCESAPVEFPARFVELLDELISATLPANLLDGFPALDAAASGLGYRRGRLYVAQLEIHDDADNVVLGHAIEAGERVVAVQHGGGYGWAALLPLLAETEYRHDAFATWGWTAHDHYRGRFVPLPSPMLSQYLGAYRPTDDRMILVGAAMTTFNPRFDLYPEVFDYRPRKREFIEALPAELRAKTSYRPYHWNVTFDDADYMKRNFPDLDIHHGDLVASLLRARLAVLDHHSTPLAITMAANIPTVAFWSDQAWPVGDQAQPLFDRLKQTGVLFDTPREAAEQIARIWPRVQEWWSGAEIQEARRAWCKEFAWASPAWPLHWMRGLAALATAEPQGRDACRPAAPVGSVH